MDYEHLRRNLERALPSRETIRNAEQQLKHLQQLRADPRTVSAYEQTLKHLQRPEMREYASSALRAEELAKQRQAETFRYHAPPDALRSYATANETAVRASVEAANSAYSAQFRRAAEEAARSLSINLPPEAIISAQYIAAEQLLKEPVREAARIAAQSVPADVQARYAETLRRAAEFLSNPDIRRMVELADPEELIDEALAPSQEAETTFGEVAAEDIEIFDLDLSSADDALLPYVSWAILVLSLAWAVASSEPSFVQYKAPLAETLAWLVFLERALKMVVERKKGDEAD